MANSASETLSKNIAIYLNGLGYNNASAGYTPTQLKQNAQVQKDGAETVTAAFDILVWIKDNWQLAVLGLVALLVLLRD